MREEQKFVGLDTYEEGAIITALMDMRNKGISEQKPTDVADELIIKILHAPIKKVRVRDEAR